MYKYFFFYNNNRFNYFKSYYSTNNSIYDPHLFDSKTGHIKHHPPIIRAWNNSTYNYNKNNQDDSLAKYDKLTKIIKSYFNLHNNIKLARSKRMRYLRIKSISKKLFLSRPEVKQTNDKIIITVYYFDKLKHNFTRKNFFFNRPYLIKQILNKKNRNKRYSRRILLKRTKFLEKRIKYFGIKQIKELKLFKDRNKFKYKYMEQSLLFYFYKYFLSLINIQVYNPIQLSNKFLNRKNKRYIRLILKKENIKINNIINANPKTILWINFNDYSFEKINKNNINYVYLMRKVINSYNYFLKNKSKNKSNLKLNFISQINKKLGIITNYYSIINLFSKSFVLKIYNILSYKVYKHFTKKIFFKQHNKISRLTNWSMSNIIKFKNLLPSLKMVIDAFYNKKTELNMINLKYFFLNSEIFTQALITKLKKKVGPKNIIDKALGNAKVFMKHNIRKQTVLNNMHNLYEYANLSLTNFPINLFQNKVKSKLKTEKDWLQKIFDKLFPRNLLFKHKKSNNKLKSKITNILNTIKYKGIIGIRVEAKGRLTRRHKAARAIMHIAYKGNLKDNDIYYDKEENFDKFRPTLLLRNDTRANTQYISKSSIRRIGSFGIKTWISAK